jgi:hypothetical protein
MKFKVKFIKDGHPVMALEGIWDDGMDEGEDKRHFVTPLKRR